MFYYLGLIVWTVYNICSDIDNGRDFLRKHCKSVLHIRNLKINKISHQPGICLDEKVNFKRRISTKIGVSKLQKLNKKNINEIKIQYVEKLRVSSFEEPRSIRKLNFH